MRNLFCFLRDLCTGLGYLCKNFESGKWNERTDFMNRLRLCKRPPTKALSNPDSGSLHRFPNSACVNSVFSILINILAKALRGLVFEKSAVRLFTEALS